MSKKRHGCLRALLGVLAIICVALVALTLVLATHTQLIVGTIQSLVSGTVKVSNTFEPDGEPIDAERDNR